jgi:branched-chain amino acid transport system permease protein
MKVGRVVARHEQLMLAMVIVAIALVPWIAGKFAVQFATRILIFALFAMSLDLIVGVAGMVSLGHAAFFGVGAYSVALVTPADGPLSVLVSLPVAMGAAGAAAAIVGALTLRARGVYLIMATLAFGQLAYYLIHDTQLGGGSDGIYLYFKPTFTVFGVVIARLDDAHQFLWLVEAVTVLSYLLLRRTLASNFGRALAGIRINEARMVALGYETNTYRLAAFTAAGALAGVAGYLHACQFGFVNPELLSWQSSGLVLMMVILGGKGRIYGAALGAVCLMLFEELLSNQAYTGAFAKHWQLPFGLAIMAIVLFAPGGLAGLYDRFPGWRRGRATDTNGERA